MTASPRIAWYGHVPPVARNSVEALPSRSRLHPCEARGVGSPASKIATPSPTVLFPGVSAPQKHGAGLQRPRGSELILTGRHRKRPLPGPGVDP